MILKDESVFFFAVSWTIPLLLSLRSSDYAYIFGALEKKTMGLTAWPVLQNYVVMAVQPMYCAITLVCPINVARHISILPKFSSLDTFILHGTLIDILRFLKVV